MSSSRYHYRASDEESSMLTGSLVDSLKLAREGSHCHGYGSLDSPSESYQSENYSSVFTLDDFDQFPVYAKCPKCNIRVLTHIEYKCGLITWLSSGACLLMGCFCGCCLIPCFVNLFKDIVHVCPDCRTTIGLYKRGRK